MPKMTPHGTSGLPEFVPSSSSEDTDDPACDDDENASDERLSLLMNDQSCKNGLVDSEPEDDEAAGAPVASTSSECIEFGVQSIVGMYLGFHVELEDDEAAGVPAATTATHSRPLSGCKRNTHETTVTKHT